jgi:RecA-family ATPase
VTPSDNQIVGGVIMEGVGLLSDYLTEPELARQLSTSPRTIKRWRAARKGPPVLLTKSRDFADLDNNELDEITLYYDDRQQHHHLDFINITQWCREPPPREWSVENRFPLRQVCLLSGEGAIGKSIIALQLCVATVLGKGWLHSMPEPGPIIYVGAEDEADELWRRTIDVLGYYNASMADLSDGFYAISLAGEDAILGRADRGNIIKPTPLFDELKVQATSIQPKLIVLDTVADIFAGQENDRSQVRQFIGILRGLAIASNSTVLVCSHPSLTGINSGTGLSGSTGWHNSVRARAYMHAVTVGSDGEQPDPDLRELEFMKNNYGPKAEKVLLRWKQGVFVPEPRTGSFEKIAADQKDEQQFMTLLHCFAEQGRRVSDKHNAPNYAPTAFSRDPRANGISKKRFADAMNRLFYSGKIRVGNHGRPSRPYSSIVEKDQ